MLNYSDITNVIIQNPSINILSLTCFARNKFLIASHNSGFAFDVTSIPFQQNQSAIVYIYIAEEFCFRCDIHSIKINQH